eukprot:155843-Prymnesium_polylepis.1
MRGVAEARGGAGAGRKRVGQGRGGGARRAVCGGSPDAPGSRGRRVEATGWAGSGRVGAAW